VTAPSDATAAADVPEGTGELTVPQCAALAETILSQMEQAIVGKRQALRLVLLGMLASGHVLVEDLPGLGKTLMARSFATALGLTFARVQFTPDLLPADLTGAPVYDPRSGDLSFRPGPVFTQLLLADEINRTPPKTQAALLEAMSEHQVSVDGRTRQLPEPFVVLATDNPIEFEGTYPLPEAQLDRFIARVRLGYPGTADEEELLRRRVAGGSPEPPTVQQVAEAAHLLAMRRAVEHVEVDDDLFGYVVALAAATRRHPHTAVGASPRAALGLLQLARAHALLSGRTFLTPEDVKATALAALGHRIVVKPELWARRLTGDDVIAEVLGQVPVPATVPSGPEP
jgi:MoxR-like ATPase